MVLSRFIPDDNSSKEKQVYYCVFESSQMDQNNYNRFMNAINKPKEIHSK